MVGLYLAPHENAVVICVDEKPSIQALERVQGYLKLPNGRTLTGHSNDYKRYGTTTLLAAFEVDTGKVTAAHTKRLERVSICAQRRPRPAENEVNRVDKGKPVARRGRKARGLHGGR